MATRIAIWPHATDWKNIFNQKSISQISIVSLLFLLVGVPFGDRQCLQIGIFHHNDGSGVRLYRSSGLSDPRYTPRQRRTLIRQDCLKETPNCSVSQAPSPRGRRHLKMGRHDLLLVSQAISGLQRSRHHKSGSRRDPGSLGDRP